MKTGLAQTALLFILLVWGFHLCGADNEAGKREVRHRVKLIHPGVSATDAVERSLVQVRSEDGQQDKFYMDVDSVVCGDDQCKIVTVRLYWNELGRYDRFALAPEVQLEKSRGELFTKTDYEQLHRLLADRGSTMWNVYPGDVVEYGNADGDVDGVSGATLLLDKSRYVEGAAWTCYTLWHWANGGIESIIEDKTGQGSSVDELRGYLRDGDRQYKAFALKQITQRRAYDCATVDVVVNSSSEKDYRIQKLLVNYAEQAESELYYSLMEQLINGSNQKLRVACLNSISRTEHDPPNAFYERLAERLAALGSYQELNGFLNIVERRNGVTRAVISQVMRLLDGDNVIVARRVYWFLSRQQLSDSENKQLEAFREKHADVL